MIHKHKVIWSSLSKASLWGLSIISAQAELVNLKLKEFMDNNVCSMVCLSVQKFEYIWDLDHFRFWEIFFEMKLKI